MGGGEGVRKAVAAKGGGMLCRSAEWTACAAAGDKHAVSARAACWWFMRAEGGGVQCARTCSWPRAA